MLIVEIYFLLKFKTGFFKESGLSLWLAVQMTAFKDVNSWLMIFVITLISSFATEVTSNTAISTLILPILAELVRFKGRIRFFNSIKNFLNEHLSGAYLWPILS